MGTAQLARPLKVFISSTSEDLHDFRAVAYLAIQDMKWAPLGMEHMGAMPTTTVQGCYEMVDAADLVVLIVAYRQGWVPTVEQGGDGVCSITALELARARERKIPVLGFVANDRWPGGLWEKEASKREWIERFRSNLNLPYESFEPETSTKDDAQRFPAFRAKIKSALVSFLERRLSEVSASPALRGIDYSQSASLALRSGRCVPLLGHGIYRDGPLSAPAIIAAFGEPSSREASLVAGAECCETYLDDRSRFLDVLEGILEEQSRAAVSPAAHDLLLAVKPPPLIVSTTCDLVLERRLGETRNVLIVSHVLRSRHGDEEGKYDGKVVVFRGLSEQTPEFCLADKFELGSVRDYCVIYKPLGSPMLHRLVGPDIQIDTVVATEADHLVLFRRLENASTGVPTAFSRPLQLNPLLFLGYPMDVWNYRLLSHVFQSVGMRGKKSIGIAVRVPTSPMEEIAWQRLRTDIVPSDPNDFARAVTAAH